MFNDKTKFAACAIGLAGGIVLIQHHAMEFWSGVLDGAVMGAWMSIMIEVVALAFFFRAGAWNKVMAVAVTAVLLAGPLHDMGKPVYESLFARGTALASAQQELTTMDERLAVTRQNLKTRQANAADPDLAGWAKYVEASTERLERLQARRAELAAQVQELRARRSGANQFADYVPLALYALALLMIQVFNATMVTTMGALARRHGYCEQEQAEEAPAPATGTPPAPGMGYVTPVTPVMSMRPHAGRRLGRSIHINDNADAVLH